MDKKITCICVLVLFLFVQTSFGHSEEQIVRYPVWVLLDSYPGIENRSPDGTISEVMRQAVADLKILAEFMAQGMVYGWDFSYVPYDKARNVQEYFSFSSTVSNDQVKVPLRYTDIRIEESRLTCWAEFVPTPDIITRQKQWSSVLYPKVSGKGGADISKGTEAIRDAYSAAANNAVREYVRTIKKNKPKEINGSIILTEIPRLYIENGKYVIDAKFFLILRDVIPYTIF